MIDEEIPAALSGERLDRIVALLTGSSRADAALLIDIGGVLVDGDVHTTGKLRMKLGQHVEIDESKLPGPSRPEADQSVVFTVVHVDDDVIVVDKPAGLVVHPGAGNPTGTLVNGLLAQYPEIAEVGESHRPGIVHRLDAGTSGLMVAARTQHAYVSLVDALAARRVQRMYRTLVWGVPANRVGVIEAPVGRDHRDPMRMAVVVDGKPARTQYRVIATFDEPGEMSELQCTLETGRTHQIRVHLSAIGHPVVGDGPYGGLREAMSVGRPFLHAAELSFTHPTSSVRLKFASALPADLAEAMAGLLPRSDGR